MTEPTYGLIDEVIRKDSWFALYRHRAKRRAEYSIEINAKHRLVASCLVFGLCMIKDEQTARHIFALMVKKGASYLWVDS